MNAQGLERRDAALTIAADDAELIRTAMRFSRQLAGGVTHDLNSTLQCVGDALFAIREDTRALVDAESADVAGLSAALEASLALADEAFDRLGVIARVVPELIPQVTEGARPVNLMRELQDIAALTRPLWKNRIDLSVEIASSSEPFACVWWVVGVAATRMVMAAAELSPRVPTGAPMPRTVLSGLQRGTNAEICVRVSRLSSGSMRTIDAMQSDAPDADATLTLCAKRLGAEFERSDIEPGVSETVFRFPIQCDTALSQSPFA
ncbi:MAG: hypothetical protein ABJF01_01175 [bacterium]